MSGIVAALFASDNTDVTIYERQNEIGKKILITGNGRCNICNSNVNNIQRYSCSEENILPSFAYDFNAKELVDCFAEMGLMLNEKNGYYYPLSNKAATVVEILKLRLKEKNVKLLTGIYVDDIKPCRDGYIVNNSYYDYVVLAFGGRAGVYKENAFSGRELLKKLQLNSSRTVPALTGVITSEDTSALKGIRTDAMVTLFNRGGKVLFEERGELQINDNGLSGIVIFNMTNHIPAKGELSDLKVAVDFLPEINSSELTEYIHKLKKIYNGRNVAEGLCGLVHKSITAYVLDSLGIEHGCLMSSLSSENVKDIVKNYKCCIFAPDNLKDYKNAQAMKGGLLLSEVNDVYMIKKYKNIYAVGEMLDVTGDCGGYNLYFAFHSGKTAGKNISMVNI